MAKRMDKEQWAIIRKRWEEDEREGYKWLIDELALQVTNEAVQMRAKREGWLKSFVSQIVSTLTKQEKQDEPEKPVGRPTKYKEEYNDQVFKLALLGLTDAQMADVLDVATTTLDDWKVRYPEFHHAIKRGKALADAEVAASMYHNACGYAHEDVHISNYQGQITVTPIIKHYPPNFQSASLWLRNRQPALWKANVEHKEAPKNPFPPDAELDEVYLSGMAESARKEALMREQREKLGIDVSDLLMGKLDG